MLKGGYITLSIQVLRMILQFSVLIIMSRSLELEEIGNFTIAVVVISLIELLRDFGLRLGTLEKQHLNQQESSNIFWLSAFWGFCSFSVLNIVLALYDIFIGESKVVLTVHILSYSLIFSGLQAQFGVEMARRGRLIALGVTDLFAQFLAGVVGLYLIFNDFGEKSLFIQFLCASLFLFTFRIIESDWYPNWPKKLDSLNELRQVSGSLGKMQILNWAGANLDTLILGMISTNSSVSLYNRAYGLTLAPQQILLDSLTNWVIPSSRTTEDKLSLDKSFLRAVHNFVSITFIPSIFVLIIFSESVISKTLGSKWIEAASVFQILCLAMIPNVYINLHRWEFIIQQKSSVLLNLTMYSKIITILLLIIGGLISINALAWALVISNALTWFLLRKVLTRESQKVATHFRSIEILLFVIGVFLFGLF